MELSSCLVPVTEAARLSELWGWHDGLVDVARDLPDDMRAAAVMTAAVTERNRGNLRPDLRRHAVDHPPA